MGRYVKKTDRRRQEDRQLFVRSELRDPPDYQKLTELIIRLSLRQTDTPQEQADATVEQPAPREQASSLS